jgi:predicted small secreted protein
MQLRFRSILLVLAASFVVAACSFSSGAQQAGSGADATTPAAVAPAAIPEAPMPQIELVAAVDPQPGQAQNTKQPATRYGSEPGGAPNNSAAQSTSSSQTLTQTQHQIAVEQIKEEEQQRIVGVLPEFNITYHWDAAPMTAGQKMGLALRSTTDPYQFAAAYVVAGYREARNEDPGFGWGPDGLMKRSGAAFLDQFDGNMIGNGILPAILHQDPRYFRMGPAHGTVMHRMLYSLATNVVCKHDNTGKWEPNYSNVGGNIIGGAISNLYYPSQNSGWGQTISSGMIVTAEGAIGSLFQEFWPDVSRKFLHRDPTHGLDAQAASNDTTQK